ncbi:DUF6314 family protein [Cognatishimia activa]|uniref:DUF6314 domain-containing protein n=1 Tax=Cognatishimia activa TaxID=1715691 RepID=A0A0P1ITT7_9RHOB|nr:DUF6314 family protein [Cognatishimia activa]CUI80424.1 hypothetical protein TA5113_01525 [Cognatishimia activa]CUK26875.1 hypothetical protein TA5114_02693 [Cognatishimia activa]
MPPSQLSDFVGAWRVTREIEDHIANTQITAAGEAVFTMQSDQVGDGLIYNETMEITFPGSAPMHATRRYFWLPNGAGQIAVHFDDNRYFHAVALETPTPKDHHQCDPDNYNVAYDFSDWPNWQASWTVKGPRKDYVMLSRYTRP